MLDDLLSIPGVRHPAEGVRHLGVDGDLRREELLESRRGHDLAIPDPAAAGEEPQPLRHVAGRGRDAAGRSERLHTGRRRHGPPAARLGDVDVPGGMVGDRRRIADGGQARRHPERRKDLLLDYVLPARVIRAPEHFPGGAVHRVRVLEGGAKWSRWPGGRRGANILLPVQNTRRGGEVRLRLEAGPVAEHVAQGHLGFRPRIRHVEPRQEATRRVIQREQMLVSSDAEGHGREGLGTGADREDGVRGHRKRVLDIPDASHDDELEPVPPYQGEGEAGDVLLATLSFENLRDPLRGIALGRRRRGRPACRHEKEGGQQREQKSHPVVISLLLSTALPCQRQTLGVNLVREQHRERESRSRARLPREANCARPTQERQGRRPTVRENAGSSWRVKWTQRPKLSDGGHDSLSNESRRRHPKYQRCARSAHPLDACEH